MVRRGRRTSARTSSGLVAGLPLLLVLAGCGAQVEREEAGAAADAFAVDVEADPGAACARLAPRTLKAVEDDGMPCSQALPAAGLPTPAEHTAVTIAGHSAQVRYPDETVFLARFDDGWKVTAAGCSRTSSDPAVPYDCAVEGS